MPRPVVLQILDSLEVGGAQRVALHLSRWCVDNDIACVLAAPRGPLLPELPEGVRFVERRARGFVGQVREIRGLQGLTGATVLHAHQRREALQAQVALGRGAPVVEHAHTVLAGRSRALDPVSFRSRAVFAVSPAVAAMVTDEFGRPPSTVHMIGNPIGRDMFVDDDSPRPRPRGRHVMRVAAMGRLVEQKDPLRFVDVVEALVRRRFPVEATWYGHGPLAAEVEAAASARGLPVRFLPPVRDVRPVLDDADVLVMTSRFEGTPLVALEAFARHTPVVATASSGSDGALGGERAVVVPDAADAGVFAEAIVGLHLGALDVDAMTSRAADFARVEAHPDRVFAPVGRLYREMDR
jgi:glycosyltransferase involved in cell wall biosynthesis